MTDPATTAQSRAPAVLVILAHHDDEFFLAGVIRDRVARGESVVVAYLTHGSVYGAASETRVQESLDALARLGVPTNAVHQIGVEQDIFDSALHRHIPAAREALRTLTRLHRFKAIHVLAWEGGHHDHDCSHCLGVGLARETEAGIPVFESSAYNAYRMPGPFFQVMRLIPRGVPASRSRQSFGAKVGILRLLALYRSQRKTFAALLPGILWRLFVRGGSEHRTVPPLDYAQPPHTGRLYYEKRFHFEFAVVRDAVASLMGPAPASHAGRKPHPGLNLRPVSATPDELQQLVTLFRAAWPRQQHLDLEYLRWLYSDNPAGRAIGVNAWQGEEIAGHYVVIPIRARYAGVTVPAALSLNTAVHPAHQGRGLFTQLAHETYDLATGRGLHHVIGVANANSTPGFVRKLSFQLVRPLDARLVSAFPVAGTEATPGWQREWGHGAYRWRLANPSARYGWSEIRGRPVWWSETDVPGIRAVMEHRLGSDAAGCVQSALPRLGFTPLKLWIGLEPKAAQAAPQGWDLPGFLRRSPLNLIFRPLQDKSLTLDESSVRFSLADFDAY